MTRHRLVLVALLFLIPSLSEAKLVRLRIAKREVVLAGRAFGLAGAYEKLSGTAEFALDPSLPANQIVVDLPLAPRNARGEVEFSADFYLLKPVDPAKGNGRLFFEIGNRGGKSLLTTFQKAAASADPSSAGEFGDGSLMRDGFTLLWLGWQWDVPDGRMRAEMPIATDHGRPITGLVRGNFIPNRRDATASVADRGHRAYAVLDPASREDLMTVRANRLDTPRVIPRSDWRWTDGQTVSLTGGFEPGMIYDVVYRTKDPKVVGVGLAGLRDIVSFFKYDRSDGNPMPTIRYAIGWGVSQTGRVIRHFVYEGFNADEQGRRAFDGLIDQLGGAGRGSFNHRFAQASRDALEHYNILFPVDQFPFTDAPETDPETGRTDSLLARAQATNTTPKLFHLLGNSEFFNRAGSLVLTDPTAARDVDPPPTTRVYFISSAPHVIGTMPPTSHASGDLVGLAAMNPLDVRPVVRALFRAMDRWVAEDTEPPASRYPRIADRTLVRREEGGWPAIPGIPLPPPQLAAYRLDFGPRWSQGIVDKEPPAVGSPYPVLVPAVDADGNDRAGIRLPEIAAPLATQAGWNFRDPSVGAPAHLAGEIGSYVPFAPTKAERLRRGDPRLSIEERYPGKDAYLGRIARSAVELVSAGYLLDSDVPALITRASAQWDWAIGAAAASR